MIKRPRLSQLLVLILLLLLPLSQCFAEEQIRLFMPDGQLKSHPVRVFITRDIGASMNPMLKLTGSHAIIEKQQGEDDLIKPMLIARHQQSEQSIAGQKITLEGTLILFDLTQYPIPFYKAVTRLTPTLIWSDNAGQNKIEHVAIGPREVYLANPVAAFAWPFGLAGGLVLFIVFLCRRGNSKAIALLCDQQNRLSLSRSQVAAWTVAIGGVVAGFGIMRIEVPAIPESLVALMELSLATRNISYIQSDKLGRRRQRAQVAAKHNPTHRAGFSDILKDYSTSPTGELSIARAQMVFWTALTLTLFVVKSILDGSLWQVPWEMVALMGLSQASYLAPKLAPPRANP